MASVRTFTLPHYEAYPVHVALFQHVTNVAFLRSQLLEANPDFDYAFLDASMVSNYTSKAFNRHCRSQALTFSVTVFLLPSSSYHLKLCHAFPSKFAFDASNSNSTTMNVY
jgi:hypothetical protein